MESGSRLKASAKRRRIALAAAVGAAVLAIGLTSYLVDRGPSPSDVVSVYMAGIERGDYESAYVELSDRVKQSVGDDD